MKYEKQLQEIKEVLGVDRWSRMNDLVAIADDWDSKGAKALDPETLQMFMMFIRRFGKVADDIALFLDYDGNLDINWSYFIDDVKKQGRCRNTRHVQINISPSGLEVFLDEFRDQEAKLMSLDSQELSDVIEKYRTHRLPA